MMLTNGGMMQQSSYRQPVAPIMMQQPSLGQTYPANAIPTTGMHPQAMPQQATMPIKASPQPMIQTPSESGYDNPGWGYVAINGVEKDSKLNEVPKLTTAKEWEQMQKQLKLLRSKVTKNEGRDAMTSVAYKPIGNINKDEFIGYMVGSHGRVDPKPERISGIIDGDATDSEDITRQNTSANRHIPCQREVNLTRMQKPILDKQVSWEDNGSSKDTHNCTRKMQRREDERTTEELDPKIIRNSFEELYKEIDEVRHSLQHGNSMKDTESMQKNIEEKVSKGIDKRINHHLQESKDKIERAKHSREALWRKADITSDQLAKAIGQVNHGFAKVQHEATEIKSLAKYENHRVSILGQNLDQVVDQANRGFSNVAIEWDNSIDYMNYLEDRIVSLEASQERLIRVVEGLNQLIQAQTTSLLQNGDKLTGGCGKRVNYSDNATKQRTHSPKANRRKTSGKYCHYCRRKNHDDGECYKNPANG
jgi:uncharacterized coiled-coil protein SlyX